MNYFQDCNTLEEAKAKYKSLVKELHPDTSGYESTEDFKEMSNQFANFKPREKSKFDDFYNHDQFTAVVQAFNHLEGLELEFIGTFFDVTGNTYEHRAAIKGMELEGYRKPRWNNKKKSWKFIPSNWEPKKSFLTEDQKKAKFGYYKASTKGAQKLG